MKDSKVASVQFEHLPGDKAANLAKVRKYVVEAAKQGADMVICPEMCVTGYWFLRDLSKKELEIWLLFVLQCGLGSSWLTSTEDDDSATAPGTW